jgi:hypothetical protein
MKLFTAPQQITKTNNKSIFCAGTIDSGEAYQWAKDFIDKLSNTQVDIYNPRREEWDNSLEQSINNDIFKEQVNWELDALEKADIIFINILPDSKSPITLLELGLYAKSDKLIVCCPKEFYRSGNVHIVCNKYYIPLFEDFDRAVEYLIKKLNYKL